MLKRCLLLTPVILACLATAASAHGLSGEEKAARTIGEIEVVLITIAVLAYAAGIVYIRREVGPDRVVTTSQTAAFGAAMSLFVIVLSPEVDDITDALFSAHMVQHLVLMLLVPPLLVWSRPVLVTIWGLPRNLRKKFAASKTVHGLRTAVWHLMHPLSVATLFLATFSFWHLPRPYAWSLEHEWLHTFEHLSFVVTAFMFWTLVIEPSGRRRMAFIPTMLFVTAIAVLSGLPGALMILSPVVLFKVHGTSPFLWGMTPLEDQQIAGLVMWIPAGIFFLAPIAWLFVKSLEDAGRRDAPFQALRTALIAVLASALACLFNAPRVEAADANAKVLMERYGCGTCHTIPGVEKADGRVGPSLAGIGNRVFIAGRLQNDLGNMTKWISAPQSVDPGNAMPDMDIKPNDAATIASYLETLRDK